VTIITAKIRALYYVQFREDQYTAYAVCIETGVISDELGFSVVLHYSVYACKRKCHRPNSRRRRRTFRSTPDHPASR
jgi:hypothetical protein